MYFSVDEYGERSDCLSSDAFIGPQRVLLESGPISIYSWQNYYQSFTTGTISFLKNDQKLTALYSTQSHVTKRQEKRRRQRRREQKALQQNGSESPIDEELATQMQVWAVHEPK